MAYLHLDQLDAAEKILSTFANPKNALDNYLSMLCSMLRGHQEPGSSLLSPFLFSRHPQTRNKERRECLAIKAIERMVGGSDNFDPPMLYWALKQAHELGLGDVISAAMDLLADLGRRHPDRVVQADQAILLRCMIQFTLVRLEGGEGQEPDPCAYFVFPSDASNLSI